MYIQLKHVSKRIKQDILLDDISLGFGGGGVAGLPGKSGSGPTLRMRARGGLKERSILMEIFYIRIFHFQKV